MAASSASSRSKCRREQLANRIIAEQTEIPSHRIRRGEIDPADFDRIAQVAREMESMPLYIDETGGLSIAQLAARARRLKRQRGLDLLVIDYIQLLQGSSHRAQQGRVQEVTEITTGLKTLAKELNVPILALSQLSRQVESRDDKRPQLSDLRESGSIEQDADVVLFVFREEYYLKNKEPRPGTEEYFKWQADMEMVHGKAEVIIGKQRHGPTGTIALQFKADVTRFSDLADAGRLPERDLAIGALPRRHARMMLLMTATGRTARSRGRRHPDHRSLGDRRELARARRTRGQRRRCAAVVKADAYGCGIEPVAGALAKAGCGTFFVANLAEARRVRAVAPDAAIYVLNGLMPGTAGAYRRPTFAR